MIIFLSLSPRLISQQSTEQDLPLNRTAHLSSTGLDNSHEQIPAGISLYHPPQPTANTNLPTPTNTPQATGLNVSKVIGAMASNVDRSTFRQQPPPMKVMSKTIQSNINQFVFLDLSIMSTTNSSQCSDLPDLQS